MSDPISKDLSDTLSALSLTPTIKTPTKKKKKKPVVADSWDDEDVSSSDDNAPEPPPPTPTTPHTQGNTRSSSAVGSPRETLYVTSPDTFSRGDGGERTERPMKTDAVARRMIAGALGVRAKSTKEQKEYDSAVRTAEKKKKDEEKERKRAEEEEKERLKKAIWED